ncbi:MAG TPA: hypothetical protein VJ488_05745 [Dehalococcoidia bacterium]|nr:hypothetical protein [Dehalococcoidia bacterium]
MTPNTGPVGTNGSITFTEITDSMWGSYTLLWSRTAVFEENDVRVLSQGSIPDGSSSYSLQFTIPEAAYGTHYLKFQCLNSGVFMNFQLGVKQKLQLNATSLRAGDTLRLSGTGFTASDSIYVRLNETTIGSNIWTNLAGSFSYEFILPQLDKGEYRLVVGSQTMSIYETHIIEILPAIEQVDGSQQDEDDAVSQNPPVTTSPAESAPAYRPPSSPVPLSPSGNTIGVFGDQPVTFNWSSPAPDSALSYILEISDSPGFSVTPIPGHYEVSGQDSYTAWLKPGTYYWRIMAVDSRGGQSDWYSSPYAFKVGEGSIFMAECLGFFHRYSIFTILAIVIVAYVVWSILSAIMGIFKGKKAKSS